MMIKRKLDDAVDKSSADQEIQKFDATVHNIWKIWTPAPSGTESYDSDAVRQTKFGRGLKF